MIAMMTKIALLLLLELCVGTGAERLRRNRVLPTSGLEFGRIAAHIQRGVMEDRTLIMEDMSMPMGADMSMPEDAGMSFDTAMSFADVDEAMSFDSAMSFPPADTVMSFAFDSDIPDIDFGDTEASPTPAPTVSATETTCVPKTPAELEALTFTSVSVDLEIDTTSSDDTFLDELTGPLLAGMTVDFNLCSQGSRALVAAGRKLEANIVAVELGSETGVSADDTCARQPTSASGAVCHVATVAFDIYVDGNSDGAADSVMQSLTDQLADETLTEGTSIVGVSLRESSPESEEGSNGNSGSSTANEEEQDNSNDTGNNGRSTAKNAMISVLALAGVCVVVVIVQRRLGKKKRGDAKSVGSSVETASNTGYDTTAVSSEGTSLA